MIELRPAFETESPYLSDLASRSKSHWPYDEDYLSQVRGMTHITAEYIRGWPVVVASEGDEILGFAAVRELKGENMLDQLWIEPKFIGKGFGRLLFFEAVKKAKALGWTKFTIASDPYAEAFYIKMGAIRTGERESKIKKGFFLPLLEYKIL
jgi:GNAT superfamily N-acetyltransferase